MGNVEGREDSRTDAGPATVGRIQSRPLGVELKPVGYADDAKRPDPHSLLAAYSRSMTTEAIVPPNWFSLE